MAEVTISHYRVKETLGEGAFSKVKLAIDVKTGNKYAVKIVSRQTIQKQGIESRFEDEIRILQQMRHPNIVQLFDVFKDEFNFYLFLEYCPNGDLFQVIVSQHFIQESDAKIYFRQFIEALSYVHKSGVAHRDLKPENLLLDQDNQVKLTDFGFSRFVIPNHLLKTSCGSPCYASPECIKGNPYNGFKSDIWSSGIILYAMVTGQLPWKNENHTKLYSQIMKADYTIPPYLSPECGDLIKKMMNINPDERPSTEEILNHPWLADVQLLDLTGYHTSPVTLKSIDKLFNREGSFYQPELPRDLSFQFRDEKFLVRNLLNPQSVSPPLIANQSRKPPSAVEIVKKHKLAMITNKSHSSTAVKKVIIKPKRQQKRTNTLNCSLP